MIQENWKFVPGYEGKYMVSDQGRVKSVKWKGVEKETIFTPWINIYGYPMVSLRKDGGKKGYGIHTLVYSAFVGAIPPGMQVNHINEIKTDNRLENLNLMTPEKNCNWGTRNERIGNKIVQYDSNGDLVDIFTTANEAERKLGIFGTSIVACCRNRSGHKTAGGFKWKYLDSIHPFVLRLQKDMYFLHLY